MTRRRNPSKLDNVPKPIYGRVSNAQFTKEETENWHTWSCGCKSGEHGQYFDIVYCHEDCPIYRALLGEETEDINEICKVDQVE